MPQDEVVKYADMFSYLDTIVITNGNSATGSIVWHSNDCNQYGEAHKY